MSSAKPYTLLSQHPLAEVLWAQRDRLFDQLIERSSRDGKTWGTRTDKEAAWGKLLPLFFQPATTLQQGQLAGWVLNDSHLVFCSLGSPWWTEDVWFIEQFFLRVGKGSNTAAMLALDILALDLGATTIVFGTSLAANDAALGRLLGRAGYTPQSQQYIKEL